MHPISLSELKENVFSAIGKDWMLITAGDKENSNTMTASWGSMGVLWNKNVATIYVRPTRYTYEFLEKSDYFTLAFFSEEWRDALTLCGTKSGREIDKVNECGFSLAYGVGDAPYYQEARLVLVCKKIYAQDMKPECFLDPTADETHYPNHDYHRLYVGEILEVYQE